MVTFPQVNIIQNQHVGDHKVYGKLTRVNPDGTVTIQYLSQKRFSPKKEVTFELAGLEFYTGTDTLLRYSKIPQADIRKDEQYMLYFGPPSLKPRKSDGTTLYSPRTLRLFLENGFGRLDINRRAQIGINAMLKDEMDQCKAPVENEWAEAVLLSATGTGTLVMGGLRRFYDKIMTFVDESRLKESQVPEETMETMNARGVSRLANTVFVVKCAKTGEYRRAMLNSMDMRKKMVEARHIDTGEVQFIDIENIYEASKMDINFANFPPLTFKCQLAGLVSVDHVKLLAKCQGKTLRLEVHGENPANENKPEKWEVHLPAVHLYMEDEEQTGCGEFFWINDAIVDAGFAVPEIKEEYRHFYYQGWGKSVF